VVWNSGEILNGCHLPQQADPRICSKVRHKYTRLYAS